MKQPGWHSLDRRDFLRLVPAGSAALALGTLPAQSGASEAPEPAPARVRRYRPLGRTGLQISDISFGSSRLSSDQALVREALERGVNYFDTAEGYRSGRSEETLGRALAGHRDEFYLASKVKCGVRSTRKELLEALEGSLRRLGTDHIDVYFNHAVNDVARLQNPEWSEFASRAKQAGKIRFTGMSGHGGRLVECLDYALDHDLIDVMLVAHNFGQDPAFYQRFLAGMDFVAIQPDLPRVLAKAHAQGVGVVAMKTLMGARLNDMRPWERGGTFAQSAFRWVLSNPHVDALIVSIKDQDQLREYLPASGAERVSAEDLRLLERYATRFGPEYCRHGCGACAEACPHGVPIAEVLRTRMYALDYGDMELAREDYARLDAGAAACLSCAKQNCLGRCPIGLVIPEQTKQTHRLLGRG